MEAAKQKSSHLSLIFYLPSQASEALDFKIIKWRKPKTKNQQKRNKQNTNWLTTWNYTAKIKSYKALSK